MDNSERIKAAAEQAWRRIVRMRVAGHVGCDDYAPHNCALYAVILGSLKEHFGESAPEQKGCACANEINEMYKQTIKARSNAELEFTTLVYRWLASNLLPATSVDTNAECGTILMVRVPPQPYEKPMGTCWLPKDHAGEHNFNRPMASVITSTDGASRDYVAHPADAPQEPTCATCGLLRGMAQHQCNSDCERAHAPSYECHPFVVLPPKSECWCGNPPHASCDDHCCTHVHKDGETRS